jgi:hypothetical protein
MTNILEIQSYHVSYPNELLKTNNSLKKENKALFLLLTISIVILGIVAVVNLNKDESQTQKN